jgi:hypothetical protein
VIIWITGKPGAGKSTLARKFAALLDAQILEGDDMREWLTPDCGFSAADRAKHAERVYRVARMLPRAVVALIAHPPGPVDCLIYVDGPARRETWKGFEYRAPEKPDIVVKT